MKKILGAGVLAIGILGLTACQSYQPVNLFHLQPNDTELKTQVENVLKSNKMLAPFYIRVLTKNGTVALMGYVKTIRQSDTAAELASKVPGVVTVQNDIIVRK